MDGNTQRRIGETVTEILRDADMGEMTEFKVRIAASNRLGIDLIGTEHKLYIRSVIEDFLLSSAEEIGGGGGNGDANSDHPEKTGEMVLEEKDRDKIKNEVNELGNRLICKISIVVKSSYGNPRDKLCEVVVAVKLDYWVMEDSTTSHPQSFLQN